MWMDILEIRVGNKTKKLRENCFANMVSDFDKVAQLSLKGTGKVTILLFATFCQLFLKAKLSNSPKNLILYY